MVFKVMSTYGTIHQRVTGKPHGQIGTQSGVAEIQLGSLCQTLQLIVRKWRQKIDDPKALEDA